MITESDWAAFERDGYLHLGRLLEGADLRIIQARVDAIMLGTADVDYDRLMMQLDSPTGEYEDAGEQSPGHKGATLAYRKIEHLERDPVFGAYFERSIFQTVCARVYGPDVPIAYLRALLMNKPARRGTKLPWHQDAFTHLDRPPLVTVWTALDPATRENGCMVVVPGSHRRGVVNRVHPWGFLDEAQVAAEVRPSEVDYLELAAGEVVLLHNWLLQSSDVNRTSTARRAFSVCYMDARTVSLTGARFVPLFETVAA